MRGSEIWFNEFPTYTTYRFDGVGMSPYSTICGGTTTPVIAAPGDVWFSNDGGMCHLKE